MTEPNYKGMKNTDDVNSEVGNIRRGGISINGASVNVGGDMVGGDAVVHGDQVYGDKIETAGGAFIGGTLQMGGGTFVGGDYLQVGSGARPDAAQQFEEIYRLIQARPADPGIDSDELVETVRRIQIELTLGPDANPAKVERWLNLLKAFAPDIYRSMLQVLSDPLVSASPGIKQLALTPAR